MSVACLFGFHKKKFHVWSIYRRADGSRRNIESKQAIYQCERCRQYLNVPVWYDEEYRRMAPYVDLHGFGRVWVPEITLGPKIKPFEVLRDALIGRDTALAFFGLWACTIGLAVVITAFIWCL